jgi:hypothetical protein
MSKKRNVPYETSRAVIAHIAKMYEELDIIPCLREHQARVAGVVDVLRKRWRADAPAVDWDAACAAALLHDVGNIVKVQLDTPQGQAIIGPEECERIEHWRERKDETIRRFGSDEYAVTRGVLADAPLSPALRYRLWSIIEGSGFASGESLLETDFVERIVLAYADRVVGPFGVVTFEERMNEAARRYGYHVNRTEERSTLVQAAYALRERIQSYVTEPLDSIVADEVQPFVRNVLGDEAVRRENTS